MPLQNRVTPTGELIATPHRGTMYGNRGILHDESLTIVRRHQVRRWLVCVLEFRGRHRVIMQPHRYTELFFLDEAVALAAGHRPCAECRHADYQQFRTLWTSALGLSVKPSADALDRTLHSERRISKGTRGTWRAQSRDVPDGAFVRWQNEFWLVHDRQLHLWSAAGYTSRLALPDTEVDVLTPPSTVATIRAGYRPGVHPSATSQVVGR